MWVLNHTERVSKRIGHCRNTNAFSNILHRFPYFGSKCFQALHGSISVRHAPVSNRAAHARGTIWDLPQL
jgi:hypothetical protein